MKMWSTASSRIRVELFAAFILIVLVFTGAISLLLHNGARPLPATAAESFRCKAAPPTPVDTPPTSQIDIGDAPREDSLTILIGRGGAKRERTSPHLPVEGEQEGEQQTLPPNAVLYTTVADLRRSDGSVLAAAQVTSYARVSRDGSYVDIYVCVDPRYPEVIDPGRYEGDVELNDERARGAKVPVSVEIQYPYVEFILLAAAIAALAGLTWARLIRRSHAAADKDSGRLAEPLSHVPIWLAALLVGVPVALAQAVSDRSWFGDIGQYVALMTTVGAAVIAATPTLYALTHLPGSRTGTSSEQPGGEQPGDRAPSVTGGKVDAAGDGSPSVAGEHVGGAGNP